MNIFEWEEDIPVTANNLNEMQNILNNNVTNGFQKNGTILWTNSSPSSSFSSQNITLSSSDYDILEFVFRYSASNDTKMFFLKTINGHGTEVSCIINYNVGVNQATSIPWRQATYIDDTHYNISDCYERNTNETTTPSISNNRLIPIYVIGYKTGLFS